MVLRIPYNSLPRLAAQRQTPPFQHLLQRLPVATQHPFSTSPTRRQAPKQEPAVPETSTPTPISTSDPTIPTTVPIADPAQPNNTLPPPPPPKKKSYIVPTFLFAASFLLVGFVSGTSLRLFISPPTPPLPGTDEDKYLTSALHEQAAKLPLVKQLTADPSWESWDAYTSMPEAHKKQHIAAGALQGSRGVGGYQRIFYNKSTGEFVSVIFFGPATTGWPGVVHGGCLATILDESCGRAAFKQWGGLPGVTASLRINYKAATLASGFYLVRVKPRQEEDLPEGERGKKHYKAFVDATVEDPVTGKVNVVADALFVGGSKNRKGGLFSKLGDRNDEAHARF